MQSSSRQTNVFCSLCQELCGGTEELLMHVSVRHFGRLAYQCYYCRCHFATPTEIERHLAGKHAAANRRYFYEENELLRTQIERICAESMEIPNAALSSSSSTPLDTSIDVGNSNIGCDLNQFDSTGDDTASDNDETPIAVGDHSGDDGSKNKLIIAMEEVPIQDTNAFEMSSGIRTLYDGECSLTATADDDGLTLPIVKQEGGQYSGTTEAEHSFDVASTSARFQNGDASFYSPLTGASAQRTEEAESPNSRMNRFFLKFAKKNNLDLFPANTAAVDPSNDTLSEHLITKLAQKEREGTRKRKGKSKAAADAKQMMELGDVSDLRTQKQIKLELAAKRREEKAQRAIEKQLQRQYMAATKIERHRNREEQKKNKIDGRLLRRTSTYLTCRMCQVQVRLLSETKKHIVEAHLPADAAVCPLCEFHAADFQTLSDHVRSAHAHQVDEQQMDELRDAYNRTVIAIRQRAFVLPGDEPSQSEVAD